MLGRGSATVTPKRRGRSTIPTKADLARLDLDNEIELWSTGAAFTADWASGREGDVAWFASGLPVAFFNQVVATGDAADPAALVRAARVLRGRDVPFLVRLRDGIDDAAVPAVEALGLHEDHDGYGAAVTRRAVADGVSRGASVAILQSSTMGRPGLRGDRLPRGARVPGVPRRPTGLTPRTPGSAEGVPSGMIVA